MIELIAIIIKEMKCKKRFAYSAERSSFQIVLDKMFAKTNTMHRVPIAENRY